VSDIQTLCDAVNAAIVSLLPSTVDVREARMPDLIFQTELRGDGVVWSYAGIRKTDGGPLGDRGRQGYVFGFAVAAVGMDWSSPAGAVKEARDLAETLRGSPSQSMIPGGQRTPNLRTIRLTMIGDDPVYLVFLSESPRLDPQATAQGGRFAFVQSWETGPLVRI